MPKTTDQIDWINSTNTKRLKDEAGITCGVGRIEEAMEALYHSDIRHQIADGVAPAQAKINTEARFIHEGYNRLNNPIWQINRARVAQLADWIEDRKHWISATNDERLRDPALGENRITESKHTVDAALAKLSRQLNEQYQRSMSPAHARLLVAENFVRRGETEQGNPVWQMHERTVPLLRRFLDEQKRQREESPWINSHARSDLQDYNITLIATRIDAEIAAYYQELVARELMRASAPAPSPKRRRDADEDEPARTAPPTDLRAAVIERIHSTMLKPNHSRYGLPSWDIHRDFMPTLLQEAPGLHLRREEDWLSAGSTRLHAAGIRGRWETTIVPAMQTLHDKLVDEFRDEGMTRKAAIEKVRSDYVKPTQGLGGVDTWRIHESAVPLLKEVMETLYPNQRKGGGQEMGG